LIVGIFLAKIAVATIAYRGIFIVGLSLAKVTMVNIAYCMAKRAKSISALKYRGSIDIFKSTLYSFMNFGVGL
jgi:hypothetical protein